VTGQPAENMLSVSVVYYRPSSERETDTLAQQKIVDYQGKKVPGEIVDFEAPPENFVTYTLSDGTTIKLKTSLLEVVRVINEYGPNGDPVYLFSAQQILNVNSPEELKQKKQ
jgi:hypothetical protein